MSKDENVDLYAKMLEYESPIKILMQEMQIQREEQISEAVLSSCTKIGVDVDKKELLKALSYDRGQYEKGYKDAKNEIVYCKDCKHYELLTVCNKHICNKYGGFVAENDYCSRAENEVTKYDL